jgi:hypothetical protein
MLRDKNKVAFISEGYFYLIDVSEYKTERIQVKLNIRIPNEKITNFDIDFNMNTLLLGTY